MRIFLIAAVACAPLLAGCSGSSAPTDAPPATYDAARIARAALQELDKNKDGTIEGPELDACPALKAALAAMDKNKDRRLSADEIQRRVEQYAARGTIPVTCSVLLNGQPLPGATVTFEPEKFMGESLKT